MNGQRPRKAPPYTAPLYDTTALTSVLANPYGQHYAPTHMSPHYYQAYLQACLPRTTADGYTLSSTYIPSTTNQINGETPILPAPISRGRPPVTAHPQTTVKPIRNHLTYGNWYQPGNCRCTRLGCPFSGSRKSVEIHMMDRHFIFPPGWERKDDWDADPSLKGKPIAIQGTSLVLDTPEAIDAWTAERKRRFPTDEKVQDKKRKLEEAAARGQLTPEDISLGPRKKHRQNAPSTEGVKDFGGQRYQRGRGRKWGDPVQREGFKTKTFESISQPVDTEKCPREVSPKIGPTTDNDEAPEIMSSKAATTPTCTLKVDVGPNSEVRMTRAHPRGSVRRIPQPKKPPRNPFASRSTLLRNLLLPEIRVTVSNLSQVIHFLVDNDFLRDVELWPGEAENRMIEVLGSDEVPFSADLPSEKPLAQT